nr:placenta specific-homeobox protein - mouse [Mus musculus]
METPQDSRQSIQKPPSPAAEEDKEEQPGGNAVVSGAPEERIDKKELVLNWLAQGEFDQGEGLRARLLEVSRLKKSLSIESSSGSHWRRRGGRKKEGEMEGRHAGDGASSSEDDSILEEGGQNIDQQPPQQEAASPDSIRNPHVLNRLAQLRYRRTRFTHSQLHDLERLFQETRYPSLRARRDLARWMGVDECDVQNWFRMRRALFQRNRRVLMFCELPPLPQSDSPEDFGADLSASPVMEPDEDGFF